MSRPVVVHIDALELVGIPEGRKYAVADAFERELARRLAEEPLGDALGDAPELVLPPLRVRADAPPFSVGAALARNVHRGLVTASRGAPPVPGKKAP